MKKRILSLLCAAVLLIGLSMPALAYTPQEQYKNLNEIAQIYGSVQTAVAGAERVFDLMDQPDEDDSGARELSSLVHLPVQPHFQGRSEGGAGHVAGAAAQIVV